MKIGPDGSLCRITSSVTTPVNLRIVKTPDDQLKDSEPLYRLEYIKQPDDDESASEKSDEVFDEEIIQAENFDEKKESSNKVDEDSDVNKPENKAAHEDSSRHKHFYQRNHNKFFERKKSARPSKSFHLKTNDEISYQNYNSANRNSNTPNSSFNVHDINPWMSPSVPLVQPANFSYPNYGYPNVMQEPGIQVPANSCTENPGKRMGLLGDKPGFTLIPNFPLNSHFIPNQTCFPSPSLNQHNYNWDSSYDTNYPNYPRPAPDPSMPVHSRRNDYYQHKRPNIKQRQKNKDWKRNQGKSNERRNASGQFNYRN